MEELLLNSRFSDDFDVGRFEKFIPEHLEDRIIRYQIDTRSTTVEEIVQFFQTYDERPKARNWMKKAIAEFFLERFFQKIREKADFGSVDYFEGEPGNPLKKNNYWYDAFNGGRSFLVYSLSKTKPVGFGRAAEISRIAVIKKGESKHVIICDARMNEGLKMKKILPRVEATRALLDGNYLFSYMRIYTRNLFQAALRPRKHGGNPMYNCDIAEYLSDNPTNLCLVYSENIKDLIPLGVLALNKMGVKKLSLPALRNLYK